MAEALTLEQPVSIKPSAQPREVGQETAPPQELGGVLFWMVGGLGVIKDLVVDTFSDELVGIGVGLTATAVGAVVGVPLAIIAWSVKMLFGVTVWLTMWVYFYANGGIHSSVKIKRFVIWFLAIIIEIVPGADLLPATTVMFFLVAILENLVRKDNLLGFAARAMLDKHSGKARPGRA